MTYDHWKTSDDTPGDEQNSTADYDERELLYDSIKRLRASHDALLDAAKLVQRISHAPFPPDGNAFDAFEALDSAIAAAEELKP